MLRFEFEGVIYEAPEYSDEGKFVLPDGRLLEVISWTEDEPRIPLSFTEIPYAEVYSDPRVLANHFGAILTVVADQ